MKKAIALILIIGFLAVDFLFFHDILRPGEAITPAQYLTGALSILVFAVAAQSLLADRHHTN
ncbi:MAG TPA: hypothetical protein VJP80_06515 [Candidatus Saccharimonadales bacterium]|nr:hypothetical protein [Candidatus Saccharimonadales bacterium]